MKLILAEDPSLAAFIGLAGKSCLILASAGVFAICLRRAAASTRHLVWAAGMVGLLFLPAFALLLPSRELALLPAFEAEGDEAALETAAREWLFGPSSSQVDAGESSSGPVEGAGVAELAPAVAQAGSRPALSPASGAQPARSASLPLLLFLWSAGALAVLLPMLVGLFLARRQVSAARCSCTSSRTCCAVMAWSSSWRASPWRCSGSTRWPGTRRGACWSSASAPATTSCCAREHEPKTTPRACSTSRAAGGCRPSSGRPR